MAPAVGTPPGPDTGVAVLISRAPSTSTPAPPAATAKLPPVVFKVLPASSKILPLPPLMVTLYWATSVCVNPSCADREIPAPAVS